MNSTSEKKQVAGIDQARMYFESLQLEFPAIPFELTSHIQALKPDLFGSRRDAQSIYDCMSFVHEVLTQRVSPFILFGHGGYGVSSSAIHYYAVTDHLALLFQLSYGDPTADEEVCRNRINAAFYGIALLFKSIDDAVKKDLIANGKRLLVVDSDFYGRGWGWIDGTPGKIDPKAWHNDEPILLSALRSARP